MSPDEDGSSDRNLDRNVNRKQVPELEQDPQSCTRRRRSAAPWWIAALLVLLLGWYLFAGESEIAPPADMDFGWELVLVNRTHSLPEGWEPDLMELSNGAQVDQRIYPQLQAMFNDMRSQDIYPVVRDGWRSSQVQQKLLEDRTLEYQLKGHSHQEALSMAEQWVAVPGTSEHQLGLAVDINPDSSMSTEYQVYSWLAQHAQEYGFIQRYPADKSDITGISNEPWHYRYVGVAAAQEMESLGYCLEEYVDWLAGQGRPSA